MEVWGGGGGEEEKRVGGGGGGGGGGGVRSRGQVETLVGFYLRLYRRV